MPALSSTQEKSPDWVTHATNVAEKRYRLGGRSTAESSEPKKKPPSRAKRRVRSEIKSLTDEEFAELIGDYWGVGKVERLETQLESLRRSAAAESKPGARQLLENAAHRISGELDIAKAEAEALTKTRVLPATLARAWVIEAFLHAKETPLGIDRNLNFQITPESDWDDKQQLLERLIGIGVAAKLKPCCDKSVMKRFRGARNSKDIAKLTYWLHWSLVFEAYNDLLEKRVIWPHNGRWYLSPTDAGPVCKLRERQVIVDRRARAA